MPETGGALSATTVARAQGLIYAPFTGMIGQMKSNTRKPADRKEKLAQALKRNMARRKGVANRQSPSAVDAAYERDLGVRSASREPLAAGVKGTRSPSSRGSHE